MPIRVTPLPPSEVEGEAHMMTMQSAGGVAACVEALTYVAGFAVMATLLNPGDTDGWSSAQRLSFVLERKTAFQVSMTFLYVVFGAVLVVLTVALHDRLRPKAPALMPIGSAFGLIWAGLVTASGMVAIVGLEAVAKLHSQDIGQAVAAWSAIAAVHDGLGGGVEIVGGLWVLVISVASLRGRSLPRPLSYLGIVVGLAGVLTVAPPLAALGAVFGLGQIPWFAWIGLLMLRRDDPHRASAEDASAFSARP